MAHEVADEVAKVGLAGADGSEAGVEGGVGVADGGFEVAFQS